MSKPSCVLVHGWDYWDYFPHATRSCWQREPEFLKQLEKAFDVYHFDFPGFGVKRAMQTPWTLEDFVEYFDEHFSQRLPAADVVIGFSFGGAVATQWKLRKKRKTKLLLVAPALARAYQKPKRWQQSISSLKAFVPKGMRSALRDIYLRHIVKNPFYRNAPFPLNYSYLNIVTIDLSDVFELLPPDDVIALFGENDKATPPQNLLDKISDQRHKERVMVFEGGTHDLFDTHAAQIVAVAQEFVSQK